MDTTDNENVEPVLRIPTLSGMRVSALTCSYKSEDSKHELTNYMMEKAMKQKYLLFMLALLLGICFYHVTNTVAEEKKLFIPDKELCAKMLRFGKQAYMRGRYLDAKEYFRRAVQADPASQVAWRYYDMAAIFALAEKVEKNSNFIAPDVSLRGKTGSQAGSAPPPPAPKAQPAPKTQFKIVDDEGC